MNLDPNFAEGYNNLGQVMEKREFFNAINSYQKAIDLNPNYSEAHFNLGNALKKIKKSSKLSMNIKLQSKTQICTSKL